ncbi:MAG: hypothetical protein JSW05_01145 [Candidatus Thorarchaeota archaeon]|nr:MAG: hypothetical protein JSW05_01145 [Candidatus Thorarchaeota archaeon]
METKFWLKMIAKIVVILLLPLSMGFEIDDFGSSLYYASVIINIGTYPRWFIPEIPTPGMQPSLNLNLLAIVAALLLCVPGIYFSHWLSRQPREKSIKKQLFAAVVFVPMMLFPVSFLFPSPMIGPSFYPYEYSLSFLPTWILIVLVLLSVFTREGAFIDAARQRQALKSVSDAQVASLPGLLGRGMAMAVTVGMVALFVPFFMLIFGWSAGEQSVMFASTSWFGSFRSWTNYA